jgi:hypothetical protein
MSPRRSSTLPRKALRERELSRGARTSRQRTDGNERARAVQVLCDDLRLAAAKLDIFQVPFFFICFRWRCRGCRR